MKIIGKHGSILFMNSPATIARICPLAKGVLSSLKKEVYKAFRAPPSPTPRKKNQVTQFIGQKDEV